MQRRPRDDSVGLLSLAGMIALVAAFVVILTACHPYGYGYGGYHGAPAYMGSHHSGTHVDGAGWVDTGYGTGYYDGGYIHRPRTVVTDSDGNVIYHINHE